MASEDTTNTKIMTEGVATIVVKREGQPPMPSARPEARPDGTNDKQPFSRPPKKAKDDTPRPPARAGDPNHRLAARAGGQRLPVAQGKPKCPVVIEILDDSDEEEQSPLVTKRSTNDNFIRRIDMTRNLPSSEEYSDYPSPRSEPLPSYVLPLEGAIEGIRDDVKVIAIHAKLDIGDPISRPTHRLDDRICRIPRSKFRCRYYSGAAFTADGLHMLRAKVLDDEKEEYAKKKGIDPADVPSFGYVRLEDTSRPVPIIGGVPRLTLGHRLIIRKKLVVAVSMFDPTNSFLRALCHQSFHNRFHLFRYFATDSNHKDDTKDALQASRLAYNPKNGIGIEGFVRLPRIHDTTEMSLFTHIFGDPAMKELIKLITHIDQLQFLVFASPKSAAQLVQVPIFLERLACAASGALGLGNARCIVHYICGTLPTGTIDDVRVTRCFDAVFPNHGVLTFDQGQECASQASRPSRYYCNHLTSRAVSGTDLLAVGCRHPKWNVPHNVIVAYFQPGYTIVGGENSRTKLILDVDSKLHAHASNQSIKVPFSIYEDLLDLDINDVLVQGNLQPTKPFHREWLVTKEHSQFHLRYLIDSLVDETCHEAIKRVLLREQDAT